METISVVLSVRNEEAKIEQALGSVRWADEIILMDNESTDSTARLAKKYGAKVYRGKNNPMLNVNKNIGFTKATSDWILSLDGDEVITPELAVEIRRVIRHTSCKPGSADEPARDVADSGTAGYWIPRKNFLFGKWIQHGLWWPDKQLRLFRRGMGAFPCKHVHEYLALTGPAGELAQPMIHHNYETVSQFIRKMDELYTESEVSAYQNQGYCIKWTDAVRFPVSDFVKTYFAQKGYKEGLHGLVLSMLQAFYSFIVFVKLWEREKFAQQQVPFDEFNRVMKSSIGQMRYWRLSAQIDETTHMFKRFWYRVLRKYARFG
jgi:glycosyltransferase involved in cell wall biosynthesis